MTFLRRNKIPELVDFENAIKELCLYNPLTGFITWSKNYKRSKEGDRAEQTYPNGYQFIRLSLNGDRKAFMAHRVAYFLMLGVWPEGIVDHIDRDIQNNKWINLRNCTQTQNIARRKMKARALPRGVVYAGHTNKKNEYMAQIAGKSLGYFLTPELASQAYEKAFIELYGTEWRT